MIALYLACLLDKSLVCIRWKRQAAQPIPNCRLPASQGVQDTQGRDKSYGVPMNPYERPPITDWKEKTTP